MRFSCKSADLTNRGCWHPAAGDALVNPVAEFRNAALVKDKVEPPQDMTFLVDEQVESADPVGLIFQQCLVPLIEIFEVLIAPVGNPSSEIGAIAPFEGPDRRGAMTPWQRRTADAR